MKESHHTLIAATLQQCAARHGWLTRDLSIQAQIDGRDKPMLPAELAQGPLGQGLADIAEAAEGATVDRGVLVETIQHVMETLFVPLWSANFAIPDGFYSTPLGELSAAAQRRLYDAGDYLTTAEAARRLGMHRNSVYTLMESGKLAYLMVDGERKPLAAAVDQLARER